MMMMMMKKRLWESSFEKSLIKVEGKIGKFVCLRAENFAMVQSLRI